MKTILTALIKIFLKLVVFISIQYLILFLPDFSQNSRRPIIIIGDILIINAVHNWKNRVYLCTSNFSEGNGAIALIDQLNPVIIG